MKKIHTDTITDINGNVYKTVKIGNQWWMAENLKVTRYRNGDPIPNVTDNIEWRNLTTGAYCTNHNDEGNVSTYGRLYNWYAVNDSRNIAPSGWHVPTNKEWQTLLDCLGGDSVAGGKMKETGTENWSSPNKGADNASGFTALPGGCRWFGSANFGLLGDVAFFWSSSENGGNDAWTRSLGHYDSVVNQGYGTNKQSGISVRLVRD